MTFAEYAAAHPPTQEQQEQQEAQQAQHTQDVQRTQDEREQQAAQEHENRDTPTRSQKAEAARLKADIRAGCRRGEPLQGLFLQAVKCIGLLSCDPDFVQYVDSQTRTLYAAVLHDPVAAGVEIAEIQQRLDRLTDADDSLKQHPGGFDTKEQLRAVRAAIRANKKKLDDLEKAAAGEQMTFDSEIELPPEWEE